MGRAFPRNAEDTQKGHINDYEEYMADVRALLDKVVVPKSNGQPIYGVTHSRVVMSCLYLQREKQDLKK